MLNTLEIEHRPAITAAPERRPGRRRSQVPLGLAGIGVAALLFVLGAVMGDNANFSEDYVSRQLSEQRIRSSRRKP